MLQRREIWKTLSPQTKDFVLKYLENNLKLKEVEFDNFLFPDFDKTLLDARAMFDMDKSTSRILMAIVKNQKICVYGDYDCDGVPGTALFRDFFEKINYKNVIYYIPHRHTEGYGLNIPAIKKLKEEHNIKLIITIDLGTTNISEIDFANELNIDVIVTDHHLPIESEDGQVLPKAYSILNNKQNNCNYANKDLCGSGTIFKLVCELLREIRSAHTNTNENFSWKEFEKTGIQLPPNGYEKWLLDLVAIATIADMVPLTNENRTLTIYGLFVLSKTNRAGLQTVFRNGKTDIRKVTETDIAFTIAPRVNSASRMAHPKIALSMFSQNLKEGIDAAHELEELNTGRKDLTKNIMKSIYKILDKRNSENKLPEVVVIGDSSWNAGVLGILASKILDRYNVNVFVYGGDEDSKNIFKGSCRSRGDVHLVKLMTEIKNKFIHFGGHELAGGFSINFENIHDLENELNKNIEKAKIKNEVQDRKDENKINVLTINLENITNDFLSGLNLIGPFGVGNSKPIFKIKNIVSSEVVRFGKTKEHLKINFVGKNLKDQRIKIEAIKFFVEKKDEEVFLENLRNDNLFLK
jgi:single-stranded-DNA-specific exonuclease